MNRNIKKLLSTLLLIAMLASALPVSTLAEALGAEDVEAAVGSPARYGIMLLSKKDEALTDGALYANDDLYITGKIPGNGIVEATPVTMTAPDGREVIASYDIKIYANANQQRKGKTWKPAGKKVQVHWRADALEKAKDVAVYHYADNAGTPELVAENIEPQDGWVTFDAESFSVYALTGVIEKDIEIGGDTYRVTVTYDSDSGIPEGAELEVSPLEVSDEEAAAMMGYGEDDIVFYSKLLDISIMHEGVEIEPVEGSNVTVSVKLLDAEPGAEIDVVHLVESGAPAGGRKLMKSNTASVNSAASANNYELVPVESSLEGDTVTFTTDSFSLYGFSSTAKALLNWTDDLLSGTILGKTTNEEAKYAPSTVDGITKGLELLDAYTVTKSENLWLSLQRVKELALGSLETVDLYTIANGQLGELVKEGVTLSDVLRYSLSDMGGFALVKDTGLRERVLNALGVTVDGMVPKAAELNVEPVETALTLDENSEAIASYDITINNADEAWQPGEGEAVQVSLACPEAAQALADGYGVELWHVADDGSASQVKYALDGDSLRFEAESFSEYTVVKTVLEKTVLASDGNTYKITVSYDANSGLPTEEEGAHLSVTEILTEDKLADVTAAIDSERAENRKVALSRTFDIKILDKDENEVQPNEGANVQVTFELVQVGNSNLTTEVYHIKQEGEELTAESLTVTNEEGNTATVDTTGFSYFTVEFTYEGKEYVLPGDDLVRLDEVLTAIGITGEIEGAEVSNSSLFEAHHSWDGYWYVYALNPFDTTEWMKVTVDGVVYEIVVTDDLIGVEASGSAAAAKFASGMDIATITIQDLGRLTGTVELASGITKEPSGRIYWNGTLAKGGTKTLSGDQVKVKYTEAATTADRALCDVEIVISDVVIYGDSRNAGTGNFVFATLRPTSNGNTYPLAITAYPDGTSNGYCEGVKAKITVNVYKTGTTTLADGTFAFTIFDLNQNKSKTTWQYITDAANHYTFSEYVTVDGSAYNVYYNTARMTKTGSDIHPQSGNGGGHSYETGIAFLARSGASLIGYNGGGMGAGATSFYIMPRAGINHPITSYSGDGGSIETTTSGTIGTGTVLPGGTAGDERVYTVPAGKHVEYKMTPASGYRMKDIKVDGTVVAEIDDSNAAIPTYTNSDTTNCVNNGDGTWTYTFPEVGATHSIVVQWEPEQDLPLSLGHIGMQPGTNGAVTHVSLENMVPAGHPATTTLLKDGTPRVMGELTSPPTMTGYTWFTFALGYTDDSGEMKLYAKSDRLAMRYTSNGQFEYSVNYNASSASNTWEVWSFRDSQGSLIIPKVYAVYVQNPSTDRGIVYTTATAIARNTTDDAFVDPQMPITFNEVIERRYYTITVNNPTDANWSYTVTQRSTEPVETLSNSTHTHVPGEAHGHALSFATPQRTIAENNTASFTFDDVYADNMLVTETVPANYTLTNILKLHGVRGTENISEGTYRIYANTVNADAADPTKQFTVTRSVDSETGGYIFQVSAYNKAGDTEVEFINTRNTVNLTIRELLDDARLAANASHDFQITLRGRETWTDGRVHYSMLGTFTVTAPNGDLTTGGSQTVAVPANAEILIIQRFGDTFTSGGVTVKVTEYDTEATSSDATVLDYRPMDKEYMITPGLTANATVTLKNVLKPRLVTVKKVLVGGDLSQSFNFTATLTQRDGITPIENYLVYTDESGLERTTNASGLVRFTLSGAGTRDLKVPYGARITVRELKAAADTYTTVYSIDNEGTPHNGTEAVIGGNPTLGITKNHEVVFTNTSDFSVFDDANTITYEFYLDKEFTRRYEFPLVSSSDIIYTTNRLTVRNGGTLDVPPQPVSDDPDSVFQGWFKNTADVGDPENWVQETGFGKIMTVTDAMNGTTVKVYAKFAVTVYATFHENKITEGGNTYWPIQQTIPMAIGDVLNLSTFEPVVPDTHREFIGWTDTLNQDGTLGAKITTNYDAYPVNGNVHFYPLYTEKKVVSFLTGASGTGATYYAPVSVDMGSEVYSAVQAILDDNKIDNKIPRLAGYTFEGWYLNYDQTTDTYDQPVALPTNDSSVYSRGTYATTAVNSDVTLYAKWTPAPNAGFSVVIWTQDESDSVGAPASEKNYNVRSVLDFSGTTDTQVTISGASGLQITYNGTSGNSTTETISGAPGTGFEFVRADTAYIAADGTTVLNVYYDRQVYTLIVRAGQKYDTDNGIASAGFTYERTTTPDPAQAHYVGESKTEVTYRMLGWRESNGTLHPVNGTNDPRVFSAYRTSLLGYYLLSWSIYNNNSVADGSRGWILDTGGLVTNALIQSSTPVTAVYAWQDASGNVYDPAQDEFYARHEAGHRGDVLDTYVGLYQAPLAVETVKNGTNWLLYYQYNVANRFKYYICTQSSRTFVSTSSPNAQLTGSDRYEATGSKGGPIKYTLSQGRSVSVEGPTSFAFNNMLDISGMLYWEPSVWDGYTGSVTTYYANGSTVNLPDVKVLSSNTNTIKPNLSSDGRTLTLFLGAQASTTNNNIWSYYYSVPVPQTGDPLVSTYASYVTAYEGDITAGTEAPLLTYFGRYHSGYLSANRYSTDGLEMKRYSSNLYDSGNWHDVNYRESMTNNRLRFYYEAPHYNQIAAAVPSDSNPAHVRMLYVPVEHTITFLDHNTNSAATAGTLTIPNDWSLDLFDPNATADNPLRTYNSTLSLTKGTTLKEAASQYSWVANYLNNVGQNSAEADMTFQGWYYDTAFSQEFNPSDAVEQDTILYARWDYPWYVVQIDPNGGVLTGGSNNGSTWTWKQPTDTVDPYDSFIKREYVESDTGDFYYHINVYDKTNTAYTDDVGGLYDYDLDSAAGINAIARTAVYDTTSPGSDGKRYTYQPGVWKLDSWDYMWYDTANDRWPTEWSHEFVFSTRITNHLKLRAVWKRVATYKVMFDPAEGQVVTNTGTHISGLYNTGDYYVDGAPMTIHVAAEPTDPKRQFVGWKSSVRANSNIYPLGTTYVVSDLDAVGDTITLVAQYSRMDMTSLRYDANGGEGKLTDVTAAADTNQIWDGDSNTLLNIERNSRVNISGGEGFTYPKAGYTLVGWSKDDDASDEAFEETSPGVWAVKASNKGKGYFALGQQNAVIDGATGNELFAVWQPPTNVTFDPNGGSGTLTDLDAIAAGIQDSYVDGNAIMNVVVGSTVPLSSGAGLLDPAGRNSTDPNYRPIIGWNSDQAAADRGVVEYALSAANYTVPAKGTNRLYAVWRPEKAIVNVHFANKDGRGYRDMDSVWKGDLLTIEVTKDYATSAFALSNSLAEDLDDDPLNPHGHNNDTHAQLLSSGIIVYASEIKPGETASDLASASAVTELYFNPTDGKAYSSYSAGSYSNEVTDVWFVYRPMALTLTTYDIEVVSGGYKKYSDSASAGSLSVPYDGVSVAVLANPAGYSDVTAAVGSAASFGPLPNNTETTGSPVSLYGMSDHLWVRVVLNAAGTGKAIQYSPDDGTSWNDYTATNDPAVYLVYYKEGNVYITVTAEVNGGGADPENVLVDPNQEISFSTTMVTKSYSIRQSQNAESYQVLWSTQWRWADSNYSYLDNNIPDVTTTGSFQLKAGESKVFILSNTLGSYPNDWTGDSTAARGAYHYKDMVFTTQSITITEGALPNYSLGISVTQASGGSYTADDTTRTFSIDSVVNGSVTSTDSGSSMNFSYTQNKDTTATFTNTRDTVNVTLSKALTDALLTSGTKDFTFSVQASETQTGGVPAYLDLGPKTRTVANNATDDDDDKTDSDPQTAFAFPKGATLTVTETVDGSAYATTYNVDSGAEIDGATVTSSGGLTADTTIAFTNSRKYTLTFAGIWNGTNAYTATQAHSFSGADYTTNPTTSFNLINLTGTTVPDGYEFLGWAKTQAAADAGTPDYDTTHLANKVFIDNDGSTDDLLPSGATSGDVVLYAVYKQANVTLTVAKTVTGAMGDTSRDFTFKLTVADPPATNEYTWTKTKQDATTDTSSASTTLQSGVTGRDTFTLKDGESIQIVVPAGKLITIEETDRSHYTMSTAIAATQPLQPGETGPTRTDVLDGAAGTPVKGASFTLDRDATLTVTNDLGAISPTGVNLTYAPYMLMLLFGIAILLIRRRRERD